MSTKLTYEGLEYRYKMIDKHIIINVHTNYTNVDIKSIDVIFEYFLRTQSIVSNVFCSSQRTIKLYYKFYNTCRAKKSQG